MRGHPLQELMEEETIYVSWQRVIGVVTWTCNEVLGPRNPNHKGWISTETLSKIEERKAKKAVVNNSWTRTAKAKAQEECKGVNRNVKMSLKADQRNYLEWGSWRGGPNPISQEIVFFQIPALIPQSQPVLLKLKSHSHFSIVFFFHESQSQCTKSHFPASKKGISQLPFYPFTTLCIGISGFPAAGGLKPFRLV